MVIPHQIQNPQLALAFHSHLLGSYPELNPLRMERKNQLILDNDMGVGFFNPRDRVDLGHNEVGQSPIIGSVDETKNIRLSETRVGLLDTRQRFEGAEHILGLSGFDFHEDVGFSRHEFLLGED
jgi:hypothetical protein